MDKQQLVKALSQFELLADIPEHQLKWVVERAELETFEKGGLFIHKGGRIDKLFILMDGLLAFRIEQNGQYKEIGRFEKGDISGALPYSRAETALAIYLAEN